MYRLLFVNAALALLIYIMPGEAHASPGTATNTVSIYTYHLKPPYIIDEANHQGLFYEVAYRLSAMSDNSRYSVRYLPRKRLNLMLNSGDLQGVVIGVNPVWFKDQERTRYLWSQAIFIDQDEVVSPVENPIEYLNAKSLNGLRLGGVNGFYYYGISENIQQGLIRFSGASNEEGVLRMLLRDRIDAGIVSLSTMNYLEEKLHWQGRLHRSRVPHDIYSRHIMVTLDQRELFEELLPLIERLNQDEEWQQRLRQFGLPWVTSPQ